MARTVAVKQQADTARDGGRSPTASKSSAGKTGAKGDGKPGVKSGAASGSKAKASKRGGAGKR